MADSISKTMLIVKSDANALKGVEQFLKNREWNIISTHDMKTAIVSLVQLKPSFVLISVDHPSKKMAKFPKIVMSAFPTCVMMFAEKSTTASFKALLDSGVEYRINPPLTGPAIERSVNKYLRDLENVEKQKNQQTQIANDKSQFDFQVEIKSGEKKETGFVSMTASSNPGESFAGVGGLGSGDSNAIAQSLLAQLTGGDENEEISPESASNQILAREKSPQNSSLQMGGSVIQFPGPGLSTDKEDSMQVSTADQQASGYKPDHESEVSQAAGSLLAPGEKRKGKGFDGADQDSMKSGQDIMIGRAKTKTGAAYSPSENVTSDPSLPDFDPAKKADSLIIGQDGKSKRNSQPRMPQDKTHLRQGGIFTEDSVFVKGVNKTLDETAVKGDGFVQSYLEDNTHLACIVVESPRFSGYLVAALGKNKKVDDEFVDLVRTRLMKFLRDAGEPIEDEGNMQVKVKRVDFEGWALEYAQFLRKSVHKGDEVAMAFFPFAEAQTKVGASANESMVSVKTNEIEPGKPLEFNLYIYLPTNKKYILYTPKGAVFQENQKDRLVRQGVSDVHIQKDEVQNLSRYKAQNHLNSLIDQYDQKDKTKTTKKRAS